MQKSFAVIFTLVLTIALSSVSFAGSNDQASFWIDTNLATAGYPGGLSPAPVNGVGGGEYVGFAIFVYNAQQFNALKVELSWDSAKAEYDAKSGTAISSESIKINGATITTAAETNTLPGNIMSLGENIQAGSYLNNYAILGGNGSVIMDWGFVYYGVLKTKATFTANDMLEITIKMSVADAGVETKMGEKTLTINETSVDVETKTWGEVKSQLKEF